MKISPYWCAYCNEEDSRRLYDILAKLQIGDMFIYKIDYLNARNFAGTDTYHSNEYVLMKRTDEKIFTDEDEVIYDPESELSLDKITRFYDYAENMSDENPIAYSEEDLPRLKDVISRLGKDFDMLPVFEISYDNRDTILTEDGRLVVF